ncbi:hypothetical protein ACP70R_049069 [Stipagrostis hirtigluma subsp. patula]
MMAAPAHPVGFVLEAQLIDCLILKIACKPYNDKYHVIEDDVYSKAPDVLVSRHAPAPGTGVADRDKRWFFFTELRNASAARTRRSRIVDGTDGKGHWHPEGGKKTVEGSNLAGAYLTKFSYRVETASGPVKPGWLMVEYGIKGVDMVICKVYRSPQGPGRPALPSGQSASTSSAVISFVGSQAAQGVLDNAIVAQLPAHGVTPHLAGVALGVLPHPASVALGVPGVAPGVPGVLPHLAHGNQSVHGVLDLAGNANLGVPGVTPHLAQGNQSVQGAMGVAELGVPGVTPHLAHGDYSVQGALRLLGDALVGVPGVLPHLAHGNQSVQGALGLVGNARLPVPSSWQLSDVVAPHLLQVSPPKRKREDAVGNLELEAAQPPPRARQHTPRGHGAAEVSAITSTARVGHQQETLPQTAGGELVLLPAARDVGDNNNPLLLQDYIDFLLLQLPDMEEHERTTEDAARFLAQSGHGNNGPIMDYGDLASLAARAAEDELLSNPPTCSEPSGSTYQELVGLPWEC